LISAIFFAIFAYFGKLLVTDLKTQSSVRVSDLPARMRKTSVMKPRPDKMWVPITVKEEEPSAPSNSIYITPENARAVRKKLLNSILSRDGRSQV
jgi:hypothetical protein